MAYESSEESGLDDEFHKEDEQAIEGIGINGLPSEIEEIKEINNSENENLATMIVSKEDNFGGKKNKFGMMIIEEGEDEGVNQTFIQLND